MSTGKPLTYDNWNAGEPNNFRLVSTSCGDPTFNEQSRTFWLDPNFFERIPTFFQFFEQIRTFQNVLIQRANKICVSPNIDMKKKKVCKQCS